MVALLGLLISACGVDDSDLRALEKLPGVDSARSSCELTCLVYVDLHDGIDQDELSAVIQKTRSVDGARSTELQLTSATGARVELTRESGTTADPQKLAGVLIEARDTTNLRDASVSVDDEGSSVHLAVTAEGIDALDQFAAHWKSVATLASPRLSFDARPESGAVGAVRLTSDGTYPDRAVELARDVLSGEQRSLVTGVVIGRQGHVILAARSSATAKQLETSLPDRADVKTDVVVAADIFRIREDSVASDRRVRAMSDALVAHGVPEGSITVKGTTLTIDQNAGTVASVMKAIAAARAAEPAAAKATSLTVLMRQGVTVELEDTGSENLLQLADQLDDIPDISELSVKVRASSKQTPKPPADTGASVTVTIEPIASIDDAVRVVARRFAGWSGDGKISSLSLYITAVDDEGRQPSVALRLDRRDEAWIASTLDRGLPESVDAAIATWDAATH